MNTRKPIGKRLRFSIFTRDGFTCRYCGKQSDSVTLHVDHIIPVCQGGTNDEENLITACIECNQGKAGRTISQSLPTEKDRLRIAQELNEQIQSAKLMQEIRLLREEKRNNLIEYWCSATGREGVDSGTLKTIMSYTGEFGEIVVYEWIDKAAAKCPWSDIAIERYISGIRRLRLIEEEEQV